MSTARIHEPPFRYLVEAGGSDPDMAGQEYLVDLASHGGIGRCGCKHWECRVSPRITKGEQPLDLNDPDFTCKHIAAARSQQYWDWFWAVMEQRPPTDNELT